MRFDSSAVHSGFSTDPSTGALTTPIYQTNAFLPGTAEETATAVEHIQAGARDEYLYTRWGNPTTSALEQKLAHLEGGESALAFACGMSAISTAILALVQQGDHIVASQQLYSGTHSLFTNVFPRFGIETTLVDAEEPKAIDQAINSRTKLLYIETPSNPLLKIIDVAAAGDIARKHALPLLIDNTFATSYNQRPLELGATHVAYSTTKFLAGHGDALGGAIIGPAEFVDHSLSALHRDLGGIIAPFNAWLTFRGLQTLHLRMERHNSNALRIAEHLSDRPAISQVYYPGLPSHPGHVVASKQMRGFTGMLSFELKEGFAAGKKFIDRVRLCTMGATLGDVKTIVTHAASTTHFIMGAAGRSKAGISEGLVRISVGIEDPNDLIEDIDQALR